ncbi:MAG TPA: hypothetical protein VFC19_09755 [Candidatus Limnocylindrales bacterium]|nr:hypothetical protein [Candidatus Limnocylindrales bacterium]
MVVVVGLNGLSWLARRSASAAPVPQQSAVVRIEGDHLLWYLRRPDGTGAFTTQSFAYGLATDKPLWGDWDGNGTFTPGVVRGATWYLRNGSGGGSHDVTPFAFGRSTDRFVAGDWDGNGAFSPGVVRGGDVVSAQRQQRGSARCHVGLRGSHGSADRG